MITKFFKIIKNKSSRGNITSEDIVVSTYIHVCMHFIKYQQQRKKPTPICIILIGENFFGSNI